jgi:hypothetical protein
VTETDTPFCNLYVLMQERMGVSIESVGDSAGKVELA